MKNKSIMKYLTLLLCLIATFLLTSCKQNVGTSEDSPVIEEVVVEENPIYNFAFSGIDMDNPYYVTLESVIRKTIQDDGHTMLTRNPKNDSDLQKEQLLELIEEEIDAIFVAPVDWIEIQPAIESLSEAGAKIINVDTQIKDNTYVDAYVGSNNTEAGAQAGAELVNLYPNGGKIVIIECSTVNSINNRITGFEEAVSKGGFEVVSRFYGTGDSESAKAGVAELIKQQPDISVIMCGNDQMALGAYEAIKEAEMDIKVMGIDGSPEMKALIKEGDDLVLGTIAQTPITIGKTAVSVAQDVLNGEKFSKTIYIETFFINDENVSIYGTESWQ